MPILAQLCCCTTITMNEEEFISQQNCGKILPILFLVLLTWRIMRFLRLLPNENFNNAWFKGAVLPAWMKDDCPYIELFSLFFRKFSFIHTKLSGAGFLIYHSFFFLFLKFRYHSLAIQNFTIHPLSVDKVSPKKVKGSFYTQI